ncbi:hypothetical protein [Stappia sp. 28M-7]|uniref:hypothetical protein n=1 Tax=Stappia sp. 28M-7 TaxID=2762596 RepID=UPI00163B9D70|nr:hypothetical protein [Stappia sp. 28M-7]MBC2858764.1 hypothetical protein [Stappia sp. 28M-7]
MKRAALVLMLMAGGCQTPSKPMEVLTPHKLSAAETTAIHDGVRRVLKDPESARFGTIVAGANADGVVTACGWVNAKNSFGGYTGEKPFLGILTDGGFVTAAVGGDSTDVAVTMTMCSRSGLML